MFDICLFELQELHLMELIISDKVKMMNIFLSVEVELLWMTIFN